MSFTDEREKGIAAGQRRKCRQSFYAPRAGNFDGAIVFQAALELVMKAASSRMVTTNRSYVQEGPS
jgi:hypothetical protein